MPISLVSEMYENYRLNCLGETPTHFTQVHNSLQLNSVIKQLDKDENIALVCINDDQPDKSSIGVGSAFSKWMEGRWGGVNASWEKTGEAW
jgi:hypothetical protein